MRSKKHQKVEKAVLESWENWKRIERRVKKRKMGGGIETLERDMTPFLGDLLPRNLLPLIQLLVVIFSCGDGVCVSKELLQAGPAISGVVLRNEASGGGAIDVGSRTLIISVSGGEAPHASPPEGAFSCEVLRIFFLALAASEGRVDWAPLAFTKGATDFAGLDCANR